MGTGQLLADGVSLLNRAAEDLWLTAQPRWPTLSIEVLPETVSTNAHALALGRAGAVEPIVIVAWSQIAGRGRAGRSWHSGPGGALTMSLALPMDLTNIPGGGALSLAAGVMVARALNQRLAPAGAAASPVRLKWPNDLWAQGRKLGGILIEAVASPALPAHQRWVVIGLGLNLAGTGAGDASTRVDLTQLSHEGLIHGALTPAQALSLAAPALLDGLSTFAAEGFAAFKPDYAQLDALAGQPVALWRQGWSEAAPDVVGQALGVDEQGALLIHDDQGQTTPWTVGEVSVRMRAHPL